MYEAAGLSRLFQVQDIIFKIHNIKLILNMKLLDLDHFHFHYYFHFYCHFAKNETKNMLYFSYTFYIFNIMLLNFIWS